MTTNQLMTPVVIALLFLGTYNLIQIRQLNQLQSETQYMADLLAMSRLISDDIDLDGLSDFETAVAIRNYLFDNHTLGVRSADELPHNKIADGWRNTTNGQAQCLCGWLAYIYVAALESQGIPARYIGIFDKSVTPNNSHASVEFLYNGKWIISDPTFNIMFVDNNNQYLGWADVLSGAEYKAVTNGNGDTERLDSYYIEVPDLVKFVVFLDESPFVLPESWNGEIDGNHVGSFDAYPPTYEFLSNGPLR